MISRVALALVLAALTIGAAGRFVRFVRRERPVSWTVAGALVFGGACAGLAACFAERAILGFTELSVEITTTPGAITGATTGPAALLALFLMVSPLEEAAKVLVVWPAAMARRSDGPWVIATFAVCAASGFAASDTAAYLVSEPLTFVRVVRALAGIFAHPFFAGIWGYALGRRIHHRARWFGPAWLFAVAGHALYDHIVFGRGPGMLVIALPMLIAMGLVAWSALRDIAPFADDRHSILPLHLPEPPSLRAVRRALKRNEQPLVVRWIAFGAFVNVGAVIVCMAVAVAVARRLGIDLSAADEADMRSNGPLLFLGAAVLGAFPLAGYLVARASGTRGVLEPALASIVAIAGTTVLLAVTAPAAVIFALAIAPVAFGLACGGAWFGMSS